MTDVTAATGAGGGPPGRVLVVTADDLLLEEVQRLAAGAGSPAEVATDEVAAVRSWPSAGLVLLGADLAGRLAGLRPPRRPGVHLVCVGEPPEAAFRWAVALGAESVLGLDRAGAWLAGVLADQADPRVPGQLVAVVPGSGGAGATTLSCALGQVAAEHGPALVVDADPWGPGADRVLGLDGEAGLRWDALVATTGRLSGAALRQAVPRRRCLGLLTWSAGPPAQPAPDVLRETLEAARRAHDLVVVDLPRRVDAWSEEAVHRCDRLLVVVRPTLTGVASARRQVEALEGRGVLVLRGRGLAAESVAAAVGVPVAAEMADQRRLEESVDLGLGPVRAGRGPLARTAAELLAGLGSRWAA